MPGLTWWFDGSRLQSAVKFHRTHMPLIPTGALLECIGDDVFAGARGSAIAMHNAQNRGQRVPLRPYQSDALPFMMRQRASILAFEMRLGKTPTSLVTHNPANGPLVIVGPLIVRDVWREWCERLFGWSPIALESKSQATALRGFPAYFVHYDILNEHVHALPNPETLIIDEIHLLQARRSQRISACTLIAQRAQRIIGLSGTPMWSDPMSMWPILNLLTPGAWGSQFDFCQRYMNSTQTAYGWKHSGIDNESELRLRLGELILQTKWKDVLGHLPPVTNTIEYVQVSTAEHKKLDSLSQRAVLESAALGKHSPEAAIISQLRQFIGQLKVKRAVELANQAMRDGHKVVLWTWHKTVHDDLFTTFMADNNALYTRITASDNQTERERRIRTFQEYGAPCVLIAPLAVAGVGISLNSADVNIFVEQDWIPATNYQASMRIFVPDRPSSNVWLFADVPVERRLMEVLGANEACQAAVGFDYGAVADKVLSQIGGLT